MRTQRLTAIVLFLTILVLQAGCGVIPRYGQIQGRVVNTAQVGLVGATVTTDDGKTATTGADGRYSLTQVATGRHSINAVLAGYVGAGAVSSATVNDITLKKGSDGFLYLTRQNQSLHLHDILQQGVVKGQLHAQGYTGVTSVNVAANATVSAPDIVMTPQAPNVDNISLLEATPQTGSALTAGSNQVITATYHYTLQSSSEGVVALYMAYETTDGKVGIIDQAAYKVQQGSSQKSLTKTISVPHAPYFVFLMQINDSDGEQKALSIVYAYTVAGVETPVAPTLQARSDSSNTVSLSWTGGKPYNFAAYKIYRSERTSVSTNDTLVTKSTTPITSFTDKTVRGGRSHYYKLYLVTLDGKEYPSNEVQTWVQPIPFNYFAPSGYMVMDPVRPKAYLVSGYAKTIQVYTTTTPGSSQISLSCTAKRVAVTPDGAQLVVTCPADNKVLLINLADTSDVTTIDSLIAPESIAISPDNLKVYIGNGSTFIVVDLATKQVILKKTLATDNFDAVVADSGALLVTTSNTKVRFYHTNNLELAGEMTISTGRIVHDPNNPLLYIPVNLVPLGASEPGTVVIEGRYPSARVGFVEGRVCAIGPLTQRIYSIVGSNSNYYLRIYTHTNGYWQQVNQVILPVTSEPGNAVISPDETKLYLYGYDSYTSISGYRALDLTAVQATE